ncbi:hypothetical protein QBC42DRAFT_269878 [Cladorrhinum samala]|uniref:ATP synthase F0 subunit 8 n=1 Tax=Cladorrhinum samala TaxID=585594 RepID=A0AAV9HN74_9PEZI|nr:hypothetical protein QBC42DRAFT_269878 [Cladorrhinum samala]
MLLGLVVCFALAFSGTFEIWICQIRSFYLLGNLPPWCSVFSCLLIYTCMYWKSKFSPVFQTC